jgi:hypothetical protein
MIFNAASKLPSIIPSLPEYILQHQIFLRNKYPYAVDSETLITQLDKSIPVKTVTDYLDSMRREVNECIRTVNTSASLERPPIRNAFAALISYVAPYLLTNRELENVAPDDARTQGRASILCDLATLCNAVLQVVFSCTLMYS